jgi:hypothetical protein
VSALGGYQNAPVIAFAGVYLTGFRRGVRWAWNRMCGKAQVWETEILELQDEYAALVNEMRRDRDERAVREAVTERLMYPDGRLN